MAVSLFIFMCSFPAFVFASSTVVVVSVVVFVVVVFSRLLTTVCSMMDCFVFLNNHLHLDFICIPAPELQFISAIYLLNCQPLFSMVLGFVVSFTLYMHGIHLTCVIQYFFLDFVSLL